MSRAWTGGSTRLWRQIRRAVLDRDGWQCGLCGEPIPRHLKPPHPRSAAVHHVLGRSVTGDDPAHLQAAHKLCNELAGNPAAAAADPAPRPRTRWSAA